MPQILPAAFCPLGQAGMTRTCGTPWPYLLSLGQASRRGFGYHTALQALTLGQLDVSSFLNMTVLVSSGEAGPCHSWSNVKFTCRGPTLYQDWKCKCMSCHERECENSLGAADEMLKSNPTTKQLMNHPPAADSSWDGSTSSSMWKAPW